MESREVKWSGVKWDRYSGMGIGMGIGMGMEKGKGKGKVGKARA
jgi:hypothetical protein